MSVENPRISSILTQRQIQTSSTNLTLNFQKEPPSYLRHQIIALRSRHLQEPLGKQLAETLASLHLLRSRGSRAGKFRNLWKNSLSSKKQNKRYWHYENKDES